jgi:hypothetical protein
MLLLFRPKLSLYNKMICLSLESPLDGRVIPHTAGKEMLRISRILAGTVTCSTTLNVPCKIAKDALKLLLKTQHVGAVLLLKFVSESTNKSPAWMATFILNVRFRFTTDWTKAGLTVIDGVE